MNLLKTSALSGISTVVRIACGLVVTKVIAMYAGPSGLAVIGQLQNLINITMLITGDFLKTATTKYTAEYENQVIQKYKVWSSALKVIFCLNVLVFFFFFLFSEQIAIYFLKSNEYGYVFKIFAFSLPFFVLNSFLLAIINGQKEIKLYIGLNIALSLVSLMLVCFLSFNFGIKGALVAYITNQSVVFFITVLVLKNKSWFKIKHFFCKTELTQYTNLVGFALITFTAIMASNGATMYIRGYLIDNTSTELAGNWQAMWTLSQISISLVTTSLSTYLLPTLSQLNDKALINNELRTAFKILLPIMLTISISMYLLRDIIITVLYTSDFKNMRDLFFWQLIGNLIKVCGWLFGYVLVAKGLVKFTVVTEVVFALSWCLLSVLLINIFGLIGAIYAFVINALLHSITMSLLYKFKVY